MPNRHTLERLSEEYRTNVPDDLREPRSFNWYLDALYEEPRIARNAHQRVVADMFDHYGTQYDEERGVVEYARSPRTTPHDGENVFYGREVHEAIPRVRQQGEIRRSGPRTRKADQASARSCRLR